MKTDFHPPRRSGILIQISLVIALGITGGWFFILATQEASGVDFLLDMLFSLVLFTPLPLFLYRLYALLSAHYILQRDGLIIRWGLRREDIPLQDIEWMRPAKEMGFRLRLPWLRWPGAIIGRRTIPELGLVEFMAADLNHMILIATPEKVFAISPENLSGFMSQFRRINELGSLTPLEAQSVYPTILLGRVWEDPLARLLILAGLGTGLLVLGLVGITLPGRETITWLDPNITAPAERLLLLPVLNGIIWLGNLVIALFFYRSGGAHKIAAYLLWGTAILVSVLLFISTLLLIF
jgi:hypothetical protein